MSLYNEVMLEERKKYLIPVLSAKAEPVPVKIKSFRESGFDKLPPPPKSDTDKEKPECKRFAGQPRKYQGRCAFIKMIKKHFGRDPFDVREAHKLGNFYLATPNQLVPTGHLRYIELKKGGRPEDRKSVMQWTGKEWTFRGETTVGSEVKGEKK